MEGGHCYELMALFYFIFFYFNCQVPQLACSLMPICEVFGSFVPKVLWTSATGERIYSHVMFSNAFTLLLRLWGFNHNPLENLGGHLTPFEFPQTLEYLICIHNSHLVSPVNVHHGPSKRRLTEVASSSNAHPIFVESFPKLKIWYQQHFACIASTLFEPVQETPVHHIGDELLKIMFRNTCEGSQSLHSVNSKSSGPKNEDNFQGLKFPAWDILEAVPFVTDASLKACTNGELSPRELATGQSGLLA